MLNVENALDHEMSTHSIIMRHEIMLRNILQSIFWAKNTVCSFALGSGL